jgi:hypothetical protein
MYDQKNAQYIFLSWGRVFSIYEIIALSILISNVILGSFACSIILSVFFTIQLLASC